MKLFKKADIAVIGVVIVLAATLIVLYLRGFWGVSAQNLTISVDGKIYGVYALDKDMEIKIGDSNICVIKDGKVSMTHADCPDQSCIHSMAISRAGESIVCLPNKVVLKITGQKADDEGVDAVAR